MNRLNKLAVFKLLTSLIVLGSLMLVLVPKILRFDYENQVLSTSHQLEEEASSIIEYLE